MKVKIYLDILANKEHWPNWESFADEGFEMEMEAISELAGEAVYQTFQDFDYVMFAKQIDNISFESIKSLCVRLEEEESPRVGVLGISQEALKNYSSGFCDCINVVATPSEMPVTLFLTSKLSSVPFFKFEKKMSLRAILAEVVAHGFKQTFLELPAQNEIIQSSGAANILTSELQKICEAKAKVRVERILLDARGVQAHHNGTSRFAICLLQAIEKIKLAKKCEVEILVNRDTFFFHQMEKLNLDFIMRLPKTRRFTTALSLTQIFDKNQILDLHRISWTLGSVFHDTISADIDNPRRQLYDDAFNFSALCLDQLFFISNYSKDIFNTKYRVLGEQKVIPNGGFAPKSILNRDGKHILIVGNRLAHKNTEFAEYVLSQFFPDLKIVSLAKQLGYGTLSNQEVAGLYKDSKVVVFPSNYEGFGLPIVEAVEFGKPIIAVDNELNREFKVRYPDNCFLYSKEYELVEILRNVLRSDDLDLSFVNAKTPHANDTWEDVAWRYFDSISKYWNQNSFKMHRLREMYAKSS